MAEWLLIAASEPVAPVKGVASAAFHIMTPVTVTVVAIPKTSNIFARRFLRKIQVAACGHYTATPFRPLSVSALVG
jgi:hypothetical protein